jgi:hypothetical protein
MQYFEIDTDGCLTLKGYRVSAFEGACHAETIQELTNPEVRFGCRATLYAETLPDLAAMITAEAIKRDLISRAAALGEQRLAERG